MPTGYTVSTTLAIQLQPTILISVPTAACSPPIEPPRHDEHLPPGGQAKKQLRTRCSVTVDIFPHRLFSVRKGARLMGLAIPDHSCLASLCDQQRRFVAQYQCTLTIILPGRSRACCNAPHASMRHLEPRWTKGLAILRCSKWLRTTSIDLLVLPLT